MDILYYNQVTSESFEIRKNLEEVVDMPGFVFQGDKQWEDVNFITEPTERYILIINHDTVFDNIGYFLEQNEKLIQDLSNNKSKLIMTSHEGDVNDLGISDTRILSTSRDINDFCTSNDISKDNILNMSTTKFLNRDVENYSFHNRWMIHMSFLFCHDKIYTNLFKKSRNFCRKYHFYTINSLPRYHRVELYLFLKNNDLLSKTNGTFFTTVHKGKEPFGEHGINSYSIPREKIQIDESYENILTKIKNEIPSGGIGRDMKMIDFSPSTTINLSRSYNSYFNIVTPSIFYTDNNDDDFIYFDEKFWKPFITFHPFIVIGKPYTLQTLKEFGFKTFSPWIDESYDTEVDYFKRRDMIQKEILRLSNMSIEEIDDWYWDMGNILIHNFKQLQKYGVGENQKFINLLKDKWSVLNG
tara:strand:+ start:1977 stop:3215 length:1239 start_codon:yes stop_codon:yes gene_type:complete